MLTRSPLRRTLVSAFVVVVASCSDPVVPFEEEFPPPDPGMIIDAAPGPGQGPTFGWMDGSRVLTGIVQRGPMQGAPVFMLDLPTLGMRHVAAGAHGHVSLRVASASDAIYLIGQEGNEPPHLDRLDPAGGMPEIVADNLTSQEFLVSRNDRWIVVRRARSWEVIDRDSGSRTVLSDTTLIRPMATADDGQQVLFQGACGGSAFCFAVADVAANRVRPIVTPWPGMIVAAAFIDGSLRIVWAYSTPSTAAVVLEEWDERTGTVATVGTTRDWPGGCLAWSWERRIAVGMVYTGTREWPPIRRVRIDVITRGGAQSIGSVDLVGNGHVSDCQLSPDGRWLLYGDPTGFRGEGRVYLKAVP